MREIKFRPKIAQHDYDTKKGHVIRFLNGRDKVKVTIMFRGREMAHPERGEQLLNRLADELGELAVVEQRPQQDGRNMVMMLAPSKTAHEDEAPAEDDDAQGAQRPPPAPEPPCRVGAARRHQPRADLDADRLLLDGLRRHGLLLLRGARAAAGA